eukprot:TRINITY_DN20604_c0_g8_i1.p1 TRINITY_DN20604_c0_g8~~TRINITY_DN20604_c0_g8_i1.p1  ORF type:complete len:662 (+),score=145.89 TRINITY_DN20604_c0_g8_i1:280-1986(+)
MDRSGRGVIRRADFLDALREHGASRDFQRAVRKANLVAYFRSTVRDLPMTEFLARALPVTLGEAELLQALRWAHLRRARSAIEVHGLGAAPEELRSLYNLLDDGEAGRNVADELVASRLLTREEMLAALPGIRPDEAVDFDRFEQHLVPKLQQKYRRALDMGKQHSANMKQMLVNIFVGASESCGSGCTTPRSGFPPLCVSPPPGAPADIPPSPRSVSATPHRSPATPTPPPRLPKPPSTAPAASGRRARSPAMTSPAFTAGAVRSSSSRSPAPSASTLADAVGALRSPWPEGDGSLTMRSPSSLSASPLPCAAPRLRSSARSGRRSSRRHVTTCSAATAADGLPHAGSERFETMRTQRVREVCGGGSEDDCLRECEFLKDRSTLFLSILRDEMHVKMFMPGEVIIHEGDVGTSMYFLRRGEVEVCTGPENRRIQRLQSGSCFGEQALLLGGNEGRRSATVRALELCDCRTIDQNTFSGILDRFPEEREYFRRLAKDRIQELKQVRDQGDLVARRRSSYGLPSSGGHLRAPKPPRCRLPASQNGPRRRAVARPPCAAGAVLAFAAAVA